MVGQDLFSKYVGKLIVEVDGEKLELDVRLKDKQKIMALMGEFGEKISEDILDRLTVIYIEILQRSYPEETKESIEAFLTKKFESFMTGMSISFGWTTKEDMERRIKERTEKKGV